MDFLCFFDSALVSSPGLTLCGRYTPDAVERGDFEPPLDGLFIFSCSSVTEMKANDLVGRRSSPRVG